MLSSSTLPALKSKSILPSIVCFKSFKYDKFLTFDDTSDYYRKRGYLQCSGDKVTDTVAQFDVIPSVAQDGLVHLKFRYSYKFLSRLTPDQDYIVALADESNEDETNWSCTLFKPSFVDGDSTKIRLLHIQSSCYAKGRHFLRAISEAICPDSDDVFTIVDVTSLMKMPKNVAFKGDNGKYLGPFLSNGTNYLQFIYDNSSDPKVAHEVFSSFGGTVTIKSKYYGQFWRLAPDDWILADVDEQVISDARSLFRVYTLDGNGVALMNLNMVDGYCGRYSKSDVKESLFQSSERWNVDECCVLQVTDLGQ